MPLASTGLMSLPVATKTSGRVGTRRHDMVRTKTVKAPTDEVSRHRAVLLKRRGWWLDSVYLTPGSTTGDKLPFFRSRWGLLRRMAGA
jgi:hypothetical protein